MRAPITAICFALFMLITPLAAHAQTINDQGAAHVKTMFQAILDKQMDASTIDGTSTLRYDGDITVEPAGTYYAVTLPASIISLGAPADAETTDATDQDITLKVGIITANVIPGETPKHWKMSFTTPSPILGHNAAGKENFRIDIGTQKSSGIWHEDIENFVKLDSTFQNITASVNGADNTVNIGAMNIIYDLTEDENNRWSGPTNMSVQDIVISPANEQAAIKIANIAMNSSVDKANLIAMTNFADMIARAQKDDIDNQGLLDTVLNMTNGLNGDIKLSGLSISKRPNDEISKILDLSIKTDSSALESLTLDNAHIHVAASNIMSPSMNIEFGFGYDGFTAAPMQSADKALLASSIKFSINKKNIPIKQIAQILANSLPKDGQASGGLSPALLLIKIPALLSNAGTEVEIINTMSNDTYAVDVNATARADLTAANSATALITASIKNLDGIITAAKTKEQTSTPEKSKNYSKMLSSLNTLKDIGTLTQNLDGTTTHNFKLTMDQTGAILLNGQPAMPLLFTLQGLF